MKCGIVVLHVTITPPTMNCLSQLTLWNMAQPTHFHKPTSTEFGSQPSEQVKIRSPDLQH